MGLRIAASLPEAACCTGMSGRGRSRIDGHLAGWLNRGRSNRRLRVDAAGSRETVPSRRELVLLPGLNAVGNLPILRLDGPAAVGPG